MRISFVAATGAIAIITKDWYLGRSLPFLNSSFSVAAAITELTVAKPIIATVTTAAESNSIAIFTSFEATTLSTIATAP